MDGVLRLHIEGGFGGRGGPGPEISTSMGSSSLGLKVEQIKLDD
jgi:hypothetical protein